MVSRSNENPMLLMVSRLRRLFRNVLRTTKLPSVITSSDVSQPVDYVYLGRGIGRHGRTQKSNQPRGQHGGQPNSQRQLHGEKADELGRMGKPVNHQPPQPGAQQSSGQ